MLRPLGLEVAVTGGPHRSAVAREIILIIFEAELPSVLTNNLDVLPAEPFEAFPRDFAERGREIDDVDAREELGDVDEARHGLNVVARATTNLEIYPV